LDIEAPADLPSTTYRRAADPGSSLTGVVLAARRDSTRVPRRNALLPQHPVLPPELTELGERGGGQALNLAVADLVLLDPVPDGLVVDAQVLGDPGNGNAGEHQADGLCPESGGYVLCVEVQMPRTHNAKPP